MLLAVRAQRVPKPRALLAARPQNPLLLPFPPATFHSSGGGGGLLPDLLRAAGHADLAEGGAWYLRRWPWIVLLAVLATPAVSGLLGQIFHLSGLPDDKSHAESQCAACARAS